MVVDFFITFAACSLLGAIGVVIIGVTLVFCSFLWAVWKDPVWEERV